MTVRVIFEPAFDCLVMWSSRVVSRLYGALQGVIWFAVEVRFLFWLTVVAIPFREMQPTL